jgi:sulfopyruvate decarboxylase TPP-binding subunit
MPIDPNHLFSTLQDAGIRGFAGVPCSILDPLISLATNHGQYIAAAVEGEALSIAAGAWLAGGQSAVLLQNSGLGNTINPLASLLIPYCWIYSRFPDGCCKKTPILDRLWLNRAVPWTGACPPP